MQAQNCCCVFSCKRPRSPGTPLHGFPDPIYEPERFRTWLYWVGGDILALDNQKIYKYRYICHRHFESKYHLGKRRVSHTAIPTLNNPGTKTREKDKEPSQSDTVEAVVTKPDISHLYEDPLMVECPDEDCAMDIEIVDDGYTDVVVDHVSDHSDIVEVDMPGDVETIENEDDNPPSDNDYLSDDGFPGFPGFQTESHSSINLMTAKLDTNVPTVKLTTNLPTAEVTTNLLITKLTTNLPTAKVTTNLQTAKLTTNLPTAEVTTNHPTAKLTTKLPTAEIATNFPTAKLTTELTTTKHTTNPLTLKFGTNLITAKLTTNKPTAKLNTNLPAAKLTTNFSTNTITTNLSIGELISNLTKGAKHITNSPTAKRITIKPTAKLTTNQATVKLSNQPTAKLNTNQPTVKLNTSVAKATPNKVLISKHNTTRAMSKFTFKPEIQPTELKSPAKVPRIDLLIRTHKKDTFAKQGQFGHCRCCLTKGTHSTVDFLEELECLNIQPSTDPRVSALVCSDCSKFLLQARQFRDMVAASERTLLKAIRDLDQDSDTKTTISRPTQGGAKKRRVDKAFLESDASTGLPEEAGDQDPVREEVRHIQEDDDFDTAGEVTISEEQTAHDETLEERPFSQLSDYNEVDNTENTDDITNDIIDNMMLITKKTRTNLSSLILDNLVTILENSTILPFVSTKGEVFDCLYCDGSFRSIHELRAHVELQHVDENNSKREIIKLMPQFVIRADISRMKCRLCNKQLTTIDNLAQHLVKEHDKTYHDLVTDPPHNLLCFDLSLKDFKCLTCEKIFPTFKKLRLHVNLHFGSFLCHLCGTKFLYPNVYFKHMQDHQKLKIEKKHVCSVCSDTFKTKKDLMYHTNRAHYDEKFTIKGVARKIKEEPIGVTSPRESPESDRETIKIYECAFCNNGTIFTSSRSAYMHRIGHLNNTRVGPYECELCDYSSPKKMNFRGHLIVHYEFKRFMCEVCNKKFRRKSQLYDHMHTHFNLKFQCPLCDATLSSKKHVKRHVKNKHPNVTVDFSD